MASPPSPVLLILLALTTFLVNPHLRQVHAATKPGAAVAPGPAPASHNLTGILEKGGQYTTLIRLLKETQIGEQIESQLKNSYEGLTLFAPTDNAFSSLKPGTLNGLTAQEQVSLVLFHVLPRYYSSAMFETTSNPVRTQATGNEGVYTLNITSTDNQANISTGVDQTRINTPLYSTFPLAVYQVDAVLLPYDLFGAKPPASAPPPASVPKVGKKTPSARAPTTESVTSNPSAASFKGRSMGWGSVVGVALMSMAGMLL